MKYLIFDLDGVLADIKKIHFDSLNIALFENDQQQVSWEDHISKFDGLPTLKKLELLEIDECIIPNIQKSKQIYTKQYIREIQRSPELISILTKLFQENFRFICVSNSVRDTIQMVLEQLGINVMFSYIVSNNDVVNPKPNPGCYLEALHYISNIETEYNAKEIYIFEDNTNGFISACNSGIKNVIRVNSQKHLIEELEHLYTSTPTSKINFDRYEWKDENLNILVPMAGLGSRFLEAGYTKPKPFIKIPKINKTIIEASMKSLGISGSFIFLIQEEHISDLSEFVLDSISPTNQKVSVNGLTEGACSTALLSKELIDNDKPLLIVNSDQYIDYNPFEFMYFCKNQECDGVILTTLNQDGTEKWSFVESDGFKISRVAEKQRISDKATVGVYYWKKGSDFAKYAEQMISKNIRTNNEFYICPVYNEAIQDGLKILEFDKCELMGLGTPTDLELFIKEL